MKRRVFPARRLMGALLLLALSGCATTEPGREAQSAAPELTFPPEWAPHEAVWLGWSTDQEHHRVQVEMIQAMVPHVRVRLMVSSDRRRLEASRALDAAGVNRDQVELLAHAIPNVWIRDSGPRFLSDGRRLAVANFAWNAYGYPRELLVGSYNLLRRGIVSTDMAERLSLPVVSSTVVSEGGALEVSNAVMLAYKGTALQRNPGVPLEEIEREYLRVYRKKKIVWLDRSPLADRVFSGPKIKNYFGDGANGHIDEYIRFVSDSTVVIAQIDPQEAEWDPLTRVDDEILRENLAQLRAALNVDGRPFEIVILPVPALRHYVRTGPLREDQKVRDSLGAWYRDFKVGDEVHWVPALSYLNFFVTNGLVLIPAYWREGLPEREREKDELVRQTFQRLFPERRVVQINPLDVNWSGGGMHCITQQQPRVS